MSNAENPTFYLCLMEDRLSANAGALTLPACNRIVYTRSGRATINGDAVSPDQARFSSAAMTVSADGGTAALLRWELRHGDDPRDLSGMDGAISERKASAALEPDIGDGWFMRCDSVAFPPGGCALTHTHRGPGIRYLLDGSIRIDTQGHSTPIEVGGAWFEAGPDPVFAQADPDVPTRFIRAMVLPPELAGKSSITYVYEEDQGKPKSQTYKGYCEETLALD